MADYYDDAVAYLTEHPECIGKAWMLHRHVSEIGGLLFGFVTPSREMSRVECGCLTTIRCDDDDVAWTKSLTQAIRADERIPSKDKDITPETLPVFAEWQRKIDRELNRTPPPRMSAPAQEEQ